MAFFLAAALGNVLALCIHAFTWWLRKVKVGVIAALGFCGLVFYIGFFVVTYNKSGKSPNILAEIVAWIFVSLVIVLPTFFGLWQYKNHREIFRSKLSSILAFYAEFVIAVIIWFNFINIHKTPFALLADVRGFYKEQLDATFTISFFVTLLAGAIYRRQFVNAWDFALCQVRQHSNNDDS